MIAVGSSTRECTHVQATWSSSAALPPVDAAAWRWRDARSGGAASQSHVPRPGNFCSCPRNTPYPCSSCLFLYVPPCSPPREREKENRKRLVTEGQDPDPEKGSMRTTGLQAGTGELDGFDIAISHRNPSFGFVF